MSQEAIQNQNFVTWPAIHTIHFEEIVGIEHPYILEIWIESVSIYNQ